MIINTSKFYITTGVNKGYFHNNEDKFDIKELNILWQKMAEKEFEKNGIYVSCISYNSNAIYSENWGCPKGGEHTVTFSGVANPEFVKDIGKWKKVVINIAEKLKEELSQSTMTVEFLNSDMIYLK